MGVTVTASKPRSPFDAEKLATEAAKMTIAAIVDHTANGQAVIGDELAPMAPYSKDYAKLRQRIGRNPTPDLTISAGMLSGIKITSTVTENGASTITVEPNTNANTSERAFARIRGPDFDKSKLKPPPNNSIAFWHHTGAGTNPKRPFFKLARIERDRIKKRLQRIATSMLERRQ